MFNLDIARLERLLDANREIDAAAIDWDAFSSSDEEEIADGDEVQGDDAEHLPEFESVPLDC